MHRCRLDGSRTALSSAGFLLLKLVETAKMNGVNPHAYLKATPEAIAVDHPASDIDKLLPWAFTPASSWGRRFAYARLSDQLFTV